MKGLFRFALTLGCLLGGEGMLGTAWAQVGCEIRASGNGSGKTLEAIISSSGPVGGTYSFKIERSGQSGVIVESGKFETQSATPSEIRGARIALSPSETYRAELEVKWPNGSSSCSASG
jgi:hypothetical protein